MLAEQSDNVGQSGCGYGRSWSMCGFGTQAGQACSSQERDGYCTQIGYPTERFESLRLPQTRPNPLKLLFGSRDRCSFYSTSQHSWRRCGDNRVIAATTLLCSEIIKCVPSRFVPMMSINTILSGHASLWSESSSLGTDPNNSPEIAGCTTNCPDYIYGSPTWSTTHRRSCDGTIRVHLTPGVCQGGDETII